MPTPPNDARTAAIVAPERALMDRPLLTDTYHRLVGMSWPRYLFLVLLLYSVIVFAFAGIYMLTGQLRHTYDHSQTINFDDCLHFSYVTLTTVGYGDIRPLGVCRPISAVQALIGVILIGLFSGLAFVRLSRVGARLDYSRHIVLGRHMDQPALMFRVTNLRLNRLQSLRATLYFMWIVEDESGAFSRRWVEMPLLPDTIPILHFTWMVVARIPEDSPLHGKSVAEIQAMNGLFVALLHGHDQTLAHLTHSNHVWLTSQVAGGRFVNVLRPGADGRPEPVSLDMLNEITADDGDEESTAGSAR